MGVPFPGGESGLTAGGPHWGVTMEEPGIHAGSPPPAPPAASGAGAAATGFPGAPQPPQVTPLHCPLLPHPQIIMACVSAVCPFAFFSVPVTLCRRVCSPLNYDKRVLSFLLVSRPASQKPTLGKTARGPLRSRPQRRYRWTVGLSGLLGKAVVFYSESRSPEGHAGIRGVRCCHPSTQSAVWHRLCKHRTTGLKRITAG